MFRFLIQKLLHKKWMVVSLLIGNILLIAIAVSHPMYKRAALNRMLTDEFETYIAQTGEYPGILSFSMTRQAGGDEGFDSVNDLYLKGESLLELPLLANLRIMQQTPTSAVNISERPDLVTWGSEMQVRLSCMSDLPAHAAMVSGDIYNAEEDEVIQAVVGEQAFVEMNLLVGDILEFPRVYGEDQTPLRVQIAGVFTYSDNTDPYWVNAPDSYEDALFIDEGVFEELFFGERNTHAVVLANWHTILDESQLRAENVDAFIERSNEMTRSITRAGGRITGSAYLDILEEYQTNCLRAQTTLFILQVPIIVLLCAFLFMISGQMLSMEQNEISILKSRGAGRGQILLLYLGQSLILVFVSFVAALPLGMFLCQVLGSSSAFLEFVRRRSLEVFIDGEVLLYAAGAMALSVLVTVIPAFRYSRISIVNLKQEKSRKKKALWKKLYLDVVIFSISLYGLYSFNRQRESMVLEVLSGATLDPLLYFSSSLFILGAGLLALRLWPWLIRLIFRIGRKFWKPEEYTSFLQIIRTGDRQVFIMEFLILTVALGIFNATIARTILSNEEANLLYQLGADVVMQEKWRDNSSQVAMGLADKLVYEEPDSNRFLEIDGVEAMAKVINVEATWNASSNTASNSVKLMGVTADAFGRVAKDMGEGTYSLVQFLNVLGSNARAVIVSSNFKTREGFALGDSITFTYNGTSMTGTIYGFFDYFPSSVLTETVILQDGTADTQENYIIVANSSYINNCCGVTPYELWFAMEDGSPDPLADYIEQRQVEVVKFENVEQMSYEIRTEPILQGTNGILTMSFIVILILCAVGFLIYWVLSIRERELLFGVLRAMGMSRRGIVRMLFNEQFFGSVLFIGVGAVIGVIASRLFVPLIQIAYTAQNQVLGVKLVTEAEDMVRLFAYIGIMFVICMAVLIRLIFRMKITNALKLGED